jgi:hypothetical protein
MYLVADDGEKLPLAVAGRWSCHGEVGSCGWLAAAARVWLGKLGKVTTR